MVHKNRTWSLLDNATIDDIVRWTPNSTACAGFLYRHDGHTYLLLNDAFGGDSAQEYAFCRVLSQDGDTYTVVQHESVTMSWCSEDRIREKLHEWLTWWQTEEGARYVSQPFTVRCNDHGYRNGNPCYLCA